MEIPSNNLEKMTWDPSCASLGGWKVTVPLNTGMDSWGVGVSVSLSLFLSRLTRARSLPLSLSCTRTHTLTYRDICLFPIPVYHLIKKWFPVACRACACMHTHRDTSFLFDPTTHTTHHAPSNIHYIDTLLTKTCKPQAHAHTRLYLIHKHILFYPLYTYQGGTSSHASVSSLTCLPTCSTPKDTQHSFSCPSNKLPSVP